MIKTNRQPSNSCKWNPLTRSITAVFVVLMSGTSILLPIPRIASDVAYAQQQSSDFSDAEVQSYAIAVIDIDDSRETALANVQGLLETEGLSTTQVDLSCTNTDSLNRLPGSIRTDVQETVVEFCNQASDIVESSGLSVAKFNAMTAAHQSDPTLAERIAIAITQIKSQRQR